MSVHYNFKTSLDSEFSTVPVDGLHISVADLKEAIREQKKLSPNAPIALLLSNYQTGEEYTDDKTLIPKNTSVLVCRAPIPGAKIKKPWHKNPDEDTALLLSNPANLINADDGGHANRLAEMASRVTDLSKMPGTEADKINAMFVQSTIEYHPTRYVKLRNSKMSGKVPVTYVCHKCSKKGHWVVDCPLSNTEVRKSYGIPSNQLQKVTDPNLPGVMYNFNGDLVVLKDSFKPEEPIRSNVYVEDRLPLPEELNCVLCEDLMKNAVLVPCCAFTFCEECISEHLMESTEHQCPQCLENQVDVNKLIPNRYLRRKCKSFDEETNGRYIKLPEQRRKAPPQQPQLPPHLQVVYDKKPSSSNTNSSSIGNKENDSPNTKPCSPIHNEPSSNPSSPKTTKNLSNIPIETSADIIRDASSKLRKDPSPNLMKDSSPNHIKDASPDLIKDALSPVLIKDVEEMENSRLKRAREISEDEKILKKSKKAKKEKKKKDSSKEKKKKHKNRKSSKSPQRDSSTPIKSPERKRSQSSGSTSSDGSVKDTSLYTEALYPTAAAQAAINTIYPNTNYYPHNSSVPNFSLPPPGFGTNPPNFYPNIPISNQVIDDPLAAFTKIMKEKDERKLREQKRRRSPSPYGRYRNNKRTRSRSRSPGRHYRGHSPSERQYRGESPTPHSMHRSRSPTSYKRGRYSDYSPDRRSPHSQQAYENRRYRSKTRYVNNYKNLKFG